MTNSETIPCLKCHKEYNLSEYKNLKNLGVMNTGMDIIEMKNCDCGSTICRTILSDEHQQDKYQKIRNLTKEDRREILDFAMKRSKEILSGINEDTEY